MASLNAFHILRTVSVESILLLLHFSLLPPSLSQFSMEREAEKARAFMENAPARDYSLPVGAKISLGGFKLKKGGKKEDGGGANNVLLKFHQNTRPCFRIFVGNVPPINKLKKFHLIACFFR